MSACIRVACEAGCVEVTLPTAAVEKAASDAAALWRRSASETFLRDLIRHQIASQPAPLLFTSPQTAGDPDQPGYALRYGIVLFALAVLLGRTDTFAPTLEAMRSDGGRVSLKLIGHTMRLHWSTHDRERRRVCRPIRHHGRAPTLR